MQLINNLTLKQLQKELENLNEKPFRAKQIFNWIYIKKTWDFDRFKNLSKELITKLKDNYNITEPQIIQNLTSKDKTRKWLIKFQDGQEVEMVYIPEKDRGTLCISSQVGCTLTCKFCHTGTQRLVRNLKTGEIVWQFLIAQKILEAEDSKITNVVFMGMGEPLFNYENVKNSIQILNDKDGLNFSKRRITLSTSGVVPELIKFCKEINTCLAISLHATNDDLRNEIMPINKKYPLEELIEACQYYQKNNSQKITFEYVMLKDINDSKQDAKALIVLIKSHNLNAKINLIPFNPWQDAPYNCSTKPRIQSFANILKSANINTTTRKTRGKDVMAACGQLKSLSKSQKLIPSCNL